MESKSPRQEVDDEGERTGKIIGWVICRLDDSLNISNLLYGQFTTSKFPPNNAWVFLGGSEKPGVETAIESGLTAEEVTAAKENPIWVEKGELRDNKYVDPDVDGGLQRPNIRFYSVSNCPVQYIDGRYYESGIHEGAPIYKNVRDWYIMRHSLTEIPEIGIVAENSYQFQEGSSISAQYHIAAASAYQEIVDVKSSIKEGSHVFKKNFIDIGRSGNRMVTADQSSQLDYNNNARADLRNESNRSVLLQLQSTATATPAREDQQATGGGAATSSGGSRSMSMSIACSEDMEQGLTSKTSFSSAPESIGIFDSRSAFGGSQREFPEFKTSDLTKITEQGNEDESVNSRNSGQSAITLSEARVDEIAMETKLTLSRKITYQTGSQAFSLVKGDTFGRVDINQLQMSAALRDIAATETDSAASKSSLDSFSSSVAHLSQQQQSVGTTENTTKKQLRSVSAEMDPNSAEKFSSAEAEIALEVTKCIEDRELILENIAAEGARLQKIYLTSDTLATASPSKRSLSPSQQHHFKLTDDVDCTGYDGPPLTSLFSQFRALRYKTFDLAEAMGAWARIVHKQKMISHRKEAKEKAMRDVVNGVPTGSNKNRPYCVMVAQKSVALLFPQSVAVKSNVKKFCRNDEPAKNAVEIKRIGTFTSKDEAVAAFEMAFRDIPQESMLLCDIQAVNKMCVNVRPCGKHYIIRSTGVPSDTPCEECGSTSMVARQRSVGKGRGATGGLLDAFPEPLAQFIWKGHNYLEKMWRDLDFLDDIYYLKKAFPYEDFKTNPLVLNNNTVLTMLRDLAEGTSGKPSLPLARLRGATEQLKDAATDGLRKNEEMRLAAFRDKFKVHPFSKDFKMKYLPPKSSGTLDIANASYGVFEKETSSDKNPNSSKRLNTTTKPNSSNDASTGIRSSKSSGALLESSGRRTGSSSSSSALNMQTAESSKKKEDDTNLLRSRSAAGGQDKVITGKMAASVAATTANGSTTKPPSILPFTSWNIFLPGANAPVTLNTSMFFKVETDGTFGPDSARVMQDCFEDFENDMVMRDRALRALFILGQSLIEKPNSFKQMGETTTSQAGAAVRLGMGENSAMREGFPRNVVGIADARATNPAGDTHFGHDSSSSSAFNTGDFARTGTGPESSARFTETGDLNNTSAVSRNTLNFTATGSSIQGNSFSHTISDGTSKLGSTGFTTTAFGTIMQGDPAIKEALNTTSFGSEGGRPLTQVEAFYGFRGTRFSFDQQRVPVAYRVPETFARTDIGEFHGLTKGRAARAYDFKEELYNAGKRKEAERKRLQSLIRAALAKHRVETDVPYLTDLIEKSKIIKGSVLMLDVAQAENRIQHYFNLIRVSIDAQRKFRGDAARRRVKQLRWDLKRAAQYLLTTQKESAKLARVLVPELIESYVKKCARKVSRRTVYRMVLHMTGEIYAVRVYECPHKFRKPVFSLCASCRTKSTVREFDHLAREARAVRSPCTCVMVQNRECWLLRIYNPLSREEFSKVLPIEQVREILYGLLHAVHTMMSPSHIERMIQNSAGGTPFDAFGLLQSLFVPTHGAFEGKRLDVSHSMSCRRAAGESSVLPLLPRTLPDAVMSALDLANSPMAESDTSEQPLDHSVLQSMSQKEHLFRRTLPKYILSTPGPSTLLECDFDGPEVKDGHFVSNVVSTTSSVLARAASSDNAIAVLSKGLLPNNSLDWPSDSRYIEGAEEDSHFQHRYNVQHALKLSPAEAEIALTGAKPVSSAQWDWQPMADLQRTRLSIERQKRESEVLLQRAQSRDVHVADAEVVLADTVVAMEHSAMLAEDTRVELLRIVEEVGDARGHIEGVMRFSKELLEVYTAETEFGQENWNQSYDGLENASGWIGLNNQRKLQKQVRIIEDRLLERDAIAVECQHEWRKAEETLTKALEDRKRAWELYELQKPSILTCERIQAAVKRDVHEAVRATLKTFSMPRKQKANRALKISNRRLQRVPYGLLFVRDPMQRMSKEFRSGLTFLARKNLTLRPAKHIASTLDGRIKNVLRCVVLVLMDHVTGNFLIHVGQDEMSVEESVQHEDFGLVKSDFSDLTAHGLENDILLRPEDVEEILSTHVDLRRGNALLQGGSHSESSCSGVSGVLDPRGSSTSMLTEPVVGDIAKAVAAASDDVGTRIGGGSGDSHTSQSTGAEGEEGDEFTAGDYTEYTEESNDSSVLITITGEVVTADMMKVLGPGFVLPSVRRRSLAGVKPLPAEGDKLKEMIIKQSSGPGVNRARPSLPSPSFYSDRRNARTEEDEKTASLLLSHLRLHPHTGRPCLGLLHFTRRLAYTKKQLNQSLWLSDLRNENPLPLINEVHRDFTKAADTELMVTVHSALRRFDVVLDTKNNNKTLSMQLEVPTQQIINSLSLQPLLLGSFLFELIGNTFSQETMNQMLKCIDFERPGVNDVRGWRKSMYEEIARPVYRSNSYALPVVDAKTKAALYLAAHAAKHGRHHHHHHHHHEGDDEHENEIQSVNPEIAAMVDPEEIEAMLHPRFSSYAPNYSMFHKKLYRGPLYVCNRFISGVYFKARFFRSADEDIRVELSAPTDGRFSSHSYKPPDKNKNSHKNDNNGSGRGSVHNENTEVRHSKSKSSAATVKRPLSAVVMSSGATTSNKIPSNYRVNPPDEYEDNLIIIDITRDELRVVVGKISTVPELYRIAYGGGVERVGVPKYRFSLLKEDRFTDLCDVLLDLLQITNISSSSSSSSSSDKDRGAAAAHSTSSGVERNKNGAAPGGAGADAGRRKKSVARIVQQQVNDPNALLVKIKLGHNNVSNATVNSRPSSSSGARNRSPTGLDIAPPSSAVYQESIIVNTSALTQRLQLVYDKYELWAENRSTVAPLPTVVAENRAVAELKLNMMCKSSAASAGASRPSSAVVRSIQTPVTPAADATAAAAAGSSHGDNDEAQQRRLYPKIDALNEQLILQALSPQWTMSPFNKSLNRQFVQVYAGMNSFLDLNMYCGNPTQALSKALLRELLRRPSGGSGPDVRRVGRLNSKSFNFGEMSLDSLASVEIMTNINKDKLFVRIDNIDIASEEAQLISSKYEMSLMAEEDAMSQKLEVLLSSRACKLKLVADVAAAQHTIKTDLVPAISAQDELVAEIEKQLNRACECMANAYVYCLQQHEQDTLKVSLDRLAMEEVPSSSSSSASPNTHPFYVDNTDASFNLSVVRRIDKRTLFKINLHKSSPLIHNASVKACITWTNAQIDAMFDVFNGKQVEGAVQGTVSSPVIAGGIVKCEQIKNGGNLAAVVLNGGRRWRRAKEDNATKAAAAATTTSANNTTPVVALEEKGYSRNRPRYLLTTANVPRYVPITSMYTFRSTEMGGGYRDPTTWHRSRYHFDTKLVTPATSTAVQSKSQSHTSKLLRVKDKNTGATKWLIWSQPRADSAVTKLPSKQIMSKKSICEDNGSRLVTSGLLSEEEATRASTVSLSTKAVFTAQQGMSSSSLGAARVELYDADTSNMWRLDIVPLTMPPPLFREKVSAELELKVSAIAALEESTAEGDHESASLVSSSSTIAHLGHVAAAGGGGGGGSARVDYSDNKGVAGAALHAHAARFVYGVMGCAFLSVTSRTVIKEAKKRASSARESVMRACDELILLKTVVKQLDEVEDMAASDAKCAAAADADMHADNLATSAPTLSTAGHFRQKINRIKDRSDSSVKMKESLTAALFAVKQQIMTCPTTAATGGGGGGSTTGTATKSIAVDTAATTIIDALPRTISGLENALKIKDMKPTDQWPHKLLFFSNTVPKKPQKKRKPKISEQASQLSSRSRSSSRMGSRAGSRQRSLRGGGGGGGGGEVMSPPGTPLNRSNSVSRSRKDTNASGASNAGGGGGGALIRRQSSRMGTPQKQQAVVASAALSVVSEAPSSHSGDGFNKASDSVSGMNTEVHKINENNTTSLDNRAVLSRQSSRLQIGEKGRGFAVGDSITEVASTVPEGLVEDSLATNSKAVLASPVAGIAAVAAAAPQLKLFGFIIPCDQSQRVKALTDLTPLAWQQQCAAHLHTGEFGTASLYQEAASTATAGANGPIGGAISSGPAAEGSFIDGSLVFSVGSSTEELNSKFNISSSVILNPNAYNPLIKFRSVRQTDLSGIIYYAHASPISEEVVEYAGEEDDDELEEVVDDEDEAEQQEIKALNQHRAACRNALQAIAAAGEENVRITLFRKQYNKMLGWRKPGTEGYKYLQKEVQKSILKKKAANSSSEKTVVDLVAGGHAAVSNNSKSNNNNNNNSNSNSHLVTGDALLLLRGGSTDMEAIQKFFNAQYDLYAPMRELRLLKEGNERNWRILNHAHFCRFVFDIAEIFLEGADMIVAGSVRTYQRTCATRSKFGKYHSPYVDQLCPVPLNLMTKTRQLFDNFNTIFANEKLAFDSTAHTRKSKRPFSDQIHSLKVLRSAFLLDTDLVHRDDHLLLKFDGRFPDVDCKKDAIPRVSLYDCIFRLLKPVPVHSAHQHAAKGGAGDSEAELDPNRGYDITAEGVRNDYLYAVDAADEIVGAANTLNRTLAAAAALPELHVRVSVGQVVYAVFHLHCQRCALPLHICKFPGCGIIRGRAVAEGWHIWGDEYGKNENIVPSVVVPPVAQAAISTAGRSNASMTIDEAQGLRIVGAEEDDVTTASLPVFSSQQQQQQHQQVVQPRYSLPTGSRALDIAIKEYLMSGKPIFNSFPSLNDSQEMTTMLTAAQETQAHGAVAGGKMSMLYTDLTVAEEVQEDARMNSAAVSEALRVHKLRLDWRRDREEARLLRTVHALISKPELRTTYPPLITTSSNTNISSSSGSISISNGGVVEGMIGDPLDVLRARGGIHSLVVLADVKRLCETAPVIHVSASDRRTDGGTVGGGGTSTSMGTAFSATDGSGPGYGATTSAAAAAGGKVFRRRSTKIVQQPEPFNNDAHHPHHHDHHPHHHQQQSGSGGGGGGGGGGVVATRRAALQPAAAVAEQQRDNKYPVITRLVDVNSSDGGGTGSRRQSSRSKPAKAVALAAALLQQEQDKDKDKGSVDSRNNFSESRPQSADEVQATADSTVALDCKAKRQQKQQQQNDSYAEVPFSIILALLGTRGLDARGHTVSLHALDPYPALRMKKDSKTATAAAASTVSNNNHGHSVHMEGITEKREEKGEEPMVSGTGSATGEIQNQKQPMDKELFSWLMTRLRLTRPTRLPYPASGERGQQAPDVTPKQRQEAEDALVAKAAAEASIVGNVVSMSLISPVPDRRGEQEEEDTLAFRFDRLHTEKVLFLDACGSLVIIQLLQGVLENASFSPDEVSGTPAAGIRFCPTKLLVEMSLGLTLVLFDVRSCVSRIAVIDDRMLSRVATALSVAQEKDIPRIALGIMDCAAQCVSVSRVAGLCTGVTVNIGAMRPVRTGTSSSPLTRSNTAASLVSNHSSFGNVQRSYTGLTALTADGNLSQEELESLDDILSDNEEVEEEKKTEKIQVKNDNRGDAADNEEEREEEEEEEEEEEVSLLPPTPPVLFHNQKLLKVNGAARVCRRANLVQLLLQKSGQK